MNFVECIYAMPVMDIENISMAQVSLLDGPCVTFIRRDKSTRLLIFLHAAVYKSLHFFLSNLFNYYKPTDHA